jgi:SEC-C motif
MVADLEEIERDILSQKAPRRDRHTLITDAIDEMEWWASFHLEDSRPMKAPMPNVPPPPAREPVSLPSHVAPQPLVRERKVGRNDLCPCGSGKEFKKCCGVT